MPGYTKILPMHMTLKIGVKAATCSKHILVYIIDMTVESINRATGD